MTVTVKQIPGPNDVEFIHYIGIHDSDPRFQKTRTIRRSALASGALDKDAEKAALVADVEQLYADYQATQE